MRQKLSQLVSPALDLYSWVHDSPVIHRHSMTFFVGREVFSPLYFFATQKGGKSLKRGYILFVFTNPISWRIIFSLFYRFVLTSWETKVKVKLVKRSHFQVKSKCYICLSWWTFAHITGFTNWSHTARISLFVNAPTNRSRYTPNKPAQSKAR